MNLLERFIAISSTSADEIIRDVGDFMAWQAGSVENFEPDVNDDVSIRTYSLELRTSGVQQRELTRRLNSLRRFYAWAIDAGILTENPFDDFSIERPILSREQIKRRQEVFSGTPEEREIARLRALNHLAENLNRSSDMQATLANALETLVSLLHLHTAWAYLLPLAGSQIHSADTKPPHDFALAAACGLPPGLEKENRYHLCKPDDCHCQAILRAGQMHRAVNVVECTRLRDSARDAGDNQGLMFHASVPIITSGTPVGIINVAADDWQFLTAADLQLLSAIGSQVAIALERARLYDLAETQRDRLERELKLAREVQASLLPDKLAEIEGFSIAVNWRPAREMAGDFYDVFSLPDGRWGFVIADVSDKGAPAAMIMAMARSLIRDRASLTSSPAAALIEVNQQFKAHSTSGMFVTVFYAALDPIAQTLTYANAGHDPPLLRRAGGSIEILRPTGPLIGILDELLISNDTLTLAPGDTLVAYTDGVTDAHNHRNEDYGLTRLIASLVRAPASDAASHLACLMDDLASFAGEVDQIDDITLFVLVREV